MVGCTCSIGVGGNVLCAKLALKKAKPDGYHIAPKGISDIYLWIQDFDIRDLPGIGYSLKKKLKEHNILSITDIQASSIVFFP